MSRADVGLGGGVWGIWSGMETVRAPGQKYEVKYVQLKRQPRLRYTNFSLPKEGMRRPRKHVKQPRILRGDVGCGEGRVPISSYFVLC